MSSDSKETPKLKLPDELLNPAAQAATNAMLAAAVKEAVASAMAAIAPILQSVAMTPEKIAQAEQLRRAPDPKAVEREARERALTQQEAEENRRNRENIQASCPHRYPNGATAISCIHNYPDRAPRGLCMVCQIYLEPKRWVIGAPDKENPRGRAYIAPEHPLYHLVLEREAAAGV